MVSVSVVVPVFNDVSRGLESNLVRLLRFCRRNFRVFEVVVVDDGSSDCSLNVLLALTKRFSELRVLSYLVNRGKGYAVKFGFRHALFDVVVFMDSDLSTGLDALPRAVGLLEQFDVVIADRHHKDSIVVPQPWYRRVSGWVFSLIPRLVLGLQFKDTQCGFKAFKSRVARILASESSIDRWAFDVELLYLCKLHAYSVSTMPITWVDDANSHVKFSHVWKMFCDVLSMRRLHG